ncbi:MAG: hypothetical protein WBR23_06810 [Candidatus Dormiibacterota bacterium]
MQLPSVASLLGKAMGVVLARRVKEGEEAVLGAHWGPLFMAAGVTGCRNLVHRSFPRGSDLRTFPRLLGPRWFRRQSLLLPGLETLAGRTLVVWSERDRDIPLQPARVRLRTHPAIDLRVMPEAGHLFRFEDPAGIARVIEEWRDRIEPLPGLEPQSQSTVALPAERGRV